MARLLVFSLACSLFFLHAEPLPAQEVESPVLERIPEADPADVESIDAIIEALYDVISGSIGEARDWDRMRSLFIPGGRLMPLGRREGGGVGIGLLSVNDYVATSGPTLEEVGFHERELARRTEHFEHMAHVFSTYEGTMEANDTLIRGINSIQLMNDGDRWWIVSVFWEPEGPDKPLPEEYLPQEEDL